MGVVVVIITISSPVYVRYLGSGYCLNYINTINVITVIFSAGLVFKDDAAFGKENPALDVESDA